MIFLRSIRSKLIFLYIITILLVTTGALQVTGSVVRESAVSDIVRRGFSIGDALIKGVEGLPLTKRGRLWELLGSKFHEYGEEALFIAAVDRTGTVRAHTNGGMAGMPFEIPDGTVLSTRDDGSSVRKTIRAGVSDYEFKFPLHMGDTVVGNIYLALDAYYVSSAQNRTRTKIFTMAGAALVLGLLVITLISTTMTTPLKKLSEGVSRLPDLDRTEEIKVFTKDEIGELTRAFNEMSQTILDQKSKLKENAQEIEEAYIATLRLLATVIDAKDHYTRGHSARVANLSVLVGQSMGLDEETLKDLEVSSMFHDVGKLRIPDSILNKSEPLSPSEYKEMMNHAASGAEILGMVSSLHKYIPAAMYHHERYDGSGYPEGLKLDEIPLIASIISIVDAYDAMVTSRPYRPAMMREEAIAELKRCKGTHFHPDITDHFISVLDRLGAQYHVTSRWDIRKIRNL
jgi:HD-GYP domain-containing protein (c-di-GMP phosphodiesterase class II)